MIANISIKRAREKLPLVAPKRFNPEHRNWLPIYHTQRDHRHYTALYSNTLHAHEFGMDHDWVIIYRDDSAGHGQWTVITARSEDWRDGGLSEVAKRNVENLWVDSGLSTPTKSNFKLTNLHIDLLFGYTLSEFDSESIQVYPIAVIHF